jgi:hypothetical protein
LQGKGVLLSESNRKCIFSVFHQILVINLGRFEESRIEKAISMFLDSVGFKVKAQLSQKALEITMAYTQTRRHRGRGSGRPEGCS